MKRQRIFFATLVVGALDLTEVMHIHRQHREDRGQSDGDSHRDW